MGGNTTHLNATYKVHIRKKALNIILKHCYSCNSYLVLVEVCNDDAHKQSESNHASQKNKDMDVDAMDLQAQTYFNCYSVLWMQESAVKKGKGKVR